MTCPKAFIHTNMLASGLNLPVSAELASFANSGSEDGGIDAGNFKGK